MFNLNKTCYSNDSVVSVKGMLSDTVYLKKQCVNESSTNVLTAGKMFTQNRDGKLVEILFHVKKESTYLLSYMWLKLVL